MPKSYLPSVHSLIHNSSIREQSNKQTELGSFRQVTPSLAIVSDKPHLSESLNSVQFTSNKQDKNGARNTAPVPKVVAGFLPVQQQILEEAARHAAEAIDESVAENTKRAYRSDWDYWRAWILHALGMAFVEGDAVPLPVVIKFITDHRTTGLDKHVDDALVSLGVKAKIGTHSMATVERRISSLSKYHQLRGLINPCGSKEIKELLAAEKRKAAKRGEKPKKKEALVLELLEQLLEQCDDSLLGIRDRAMLFFAFSSGGRRRSEVAQARMEGLRIIGSDFIYTLPRSKTNQKGESDHTVPLAGRAAEALRAWLEASEITDGPIFRTVYRDETISDKELSGKTVANVIKRRAQKAGLDPKIFSGHSPRSGFITESGKQGVSLGESMGMSGHKTVRTAVGYFQKGDVLNNSAARLADKK